LPRLQQLQLVESDYYVQQAAYLAEEQLRSQVAVELGLGPSQVQTWAVASATGWMYTLSSRGLDAKRGKIWSHLTMPGVPTGALATSHEGQIVFLATQDGLSRSMDAGATWEQLQIRPSPGMKAHATAIAVNPLNHRQVFAALSAIPEAGSIPSNPLGIYVSHDEGQSWSQLPDSPQDYITDRLCLDPMVPDILFGRTGIGTWRYRLEPVP
jgi:photosystem II stability/assembly factor-like uncharacterized protein